MRILALAAAALLTPAAAHAAGLMEINPDAKSGPVVGNAGGTPDTQANTPYGAQTANPAPPARATLPRPKPPSKENTPSASADAP
jgi:hypothetical protein